MFARKYHCRPYPQKPSIFFGLEACFSHPGPDFAILGEMGEIAPNWQHLRQCALFRPLAARWLGTLLIPVMVSRNGAHVPPLGAFGPPLAEMERNGRDFAKWAELCVSCRSDRPGPGPGRCDTALAAGAPPPLTRPRQTYPVRGRSAPPPSLQ